MHKALLVVDITATVFSLLYFWISLGYPRGTMAQPGPGLYPLLLGILVLVASIGSLIFDLLNPIQGTLKIPKGNNLGRVLAVAGGAVSYVLLLPYAGHLLASMVVVFVVFQAMGLPSWPAKIGFTIVLALGSYYLFDVLLKVPLPKGILG